MLTLCEEVLELVGRYCPNGVRHNFFKGKTENRVIKDAKMRKTKSSKI